MFEDCESFIKEPILLKRCKYNCYFGDFNEFEKWDIVYCLLISNVGDVAMEYFACLISEWKSCLYYDGKFSEIIAKKNFMIFIRKLAKFYMHSTKLQDTSFKEEITEAHEKELQIMAP